MRRIRLLAMLLSGLCCSGAWAADCATYRDGVTLLPKEVTGTLDKSIAAVQSHKAQALFAVSDRKVLLVRRVVTNLDDRSGNFRLELRQRDLDGNLNIHLGGQVLTRLAQANLFAGLTTDNVFAVRRDICEDARKCEDHLPGSEQLPFMLNDLLQCNRYAKGAYLYDDGIYLVDMTASPGKLPVGTALFFNRVGVTYRLAGIIMQD